MTGIKLDASPLIHALVKERARRREAILGAAQALAARMEAHARANRPWADRTGRARGAIRGRAEAAGARIRITLTGGAPYSAALETGYGRRYAIIGPTARRFAPELIRMLEGEGSA
jgi:hypothetical protein